MAEVRSDLTRITLAILFLALLIGTSLWILSPFLPAVVWAMTLVIATWPIMRQVQARLWNSRGLAVTVMTLVLLILFVIPFWFAIGTIVEHSSEIVGFAESVTTMQMPPPPAWLADVPLVGDRASQAWQSATDAGVPAILQKVRPYTSMITDWFVGAVGSFGMVIVQFLLTVAVSAIMFASGERAAASVIRFGRRLAGDRGEEAVRLAAAAIRGVALGVVVTAFIQTAIGAAGVYIAGVPYAGLLSAVIFMLCIAQVGPALVLIPAIIWMYYSGDTGWATVLLVISVVAIGIDNFIRPVLIRRGADLPILLILAGVIGGLIAFGLIGIFIGPTVLAVGYTLLDAWIKEGDADEAR
ncbi:MAG TPA: AI-2E family transporter YdiK [Verrucomicrobiae bacterium]|nr:AI-2E family transporter YdiK [Verrucomicrobiae bacterium]